MSLKTLHSKQWTLFHELHEALDLEFAADPRNFTGYAGTARLLEENRKLEARLLRKKKGVDAVKACRKTAGLPQTNEFEVTFNVSGYVTQTVTITDLKMTPEKLREGLQSGEIATTIQENGSVAFVSSGKKVGTVASVENDCEYGDFNVEDQWG